MRTKNAFYNIITGLIPQLIIGVLGFFKIKIFINTLGVELNGLMQLFAQIFAYLALAEGGIGTAIQFRLYKLLANQDYEKINNLLKGSKEVFKKIAYIIIIIALLLSVRLDFFIKDNPFGLIYIQIAFFLYLISSTISYFYVSDRILLSSDQKLYKINIIFNSAQIIKFILEVILLLIGTNIFVLIILYIILNFVSFNVLKLVVRKQYPWYSTKTAVPNYEFKNDLKHLFPHKIIDTVAKNTDVIVISSFLGIVSTSIYGVYNYIMSFITQAINQISSALFSIIGNYNVTETKEKVKELFNQYLFITLAIANILCIPILFTLNPFINIWVGNKMVVDFTTMMLFIIILYYNITMIPVGTFVSVNGLFKETKIAALIEMTLNIVLSIILVKIYGIKGVLIGTVISVLISSFLYTPHILYKNVFNQNPLSYYLKVLKNLVIMMVSVTTLYLLTSTVKYTINSVFVWIAFGTVIFIINLIICLGLYIIFFKKEFISIYNKIKFRRRL